MGPGIVHGCKAIVKYVCAHMHTRFIYKGVIIMNLQLYNVYKTFNFILIVRAINFTSLLLHCLGIILDNTVCVVYCLGIILNTIAWIVYCLGIIHVLDTIVYLTSTEPSNFGKTIFTQFQNHWILHTLLRLVIGLTNLIQYHSKVSCTPVYNHWTGPVDWTGGIHWQTSLVDSLNFVCKPVPAIYSNSYQLHVYKCYALLASRRACTRNQKHIQPLGIHSAGHIYLPAEFTRRAC